MLVFLMRDLRVDLLHPDQPPLATQSIIYRDPNRSYPMEEGEELNQVLHELYQRFHSHALKLANSGYFSFIFDNIRDLHEGSEEPTLIFFTKPDLFESKLEAHFQTFFARNIDEPFFHNYEFEDVEVEYETTYNGRAWSRLLNMTKEDQQLDQLFKGEVEVSSPWKEAQFGYMSDPWISSKKLRSWVKKKGTDDEAKGQL